MGEAKKRKRLTARVLEAHPWCCYCGGVTPATTVDHVPGRVMFLDRRRPGGLEVPACGPCNHATSRAELVGAVFSHISVFDDPPLVPEEKFARVCRQAQAACPDWAAEVAAGSGQRFDQFGDRTGVPGKAVAGFKIGPQSRHYIEVIGAKLGFALHFNKVGHILPSGGTVDVLFKSNYELVTSGMPPEFLNMLGPMETLRQGQWQAGDFFNFRGAWAPDGSVGVYLSMIGVGFATVSFVIADRSHWPDDPGRGRRFLPGDFKNLVVPA